MSKLILVAVALVGAAHFMTEHQVVEISGQIKTVLVQTVDAAQQSIAWIQQSSGKK